MGCDIHLYAEVKVDDVWYFYGVVPMQRYYSVFAKMAGVRSDGAIKPIANPRGLPADISTITQIYADRWFLEGHSYSYLSAFEIKKLMAWIKDNIDKFGIPFWKWKLENIGYFFW